MIEDSLDNARRAVDAPETEQEAAGPAGTGAGETLPPRRRRRWLRRLVKVFIWFVVVVLVLVTAATIEALYRVRQPLAHYDGTIRLPGLTAPVTVYRDAQAVPNLYATNTDDLFAAQGYVTAQERFWEMDFRRHLTSGRLAELFGADQLRTDEYLRTMGWRHVAEQEWQLISPDSRRYLTDYARGVNAYLAGKNTSQVSLEYSVLGLQTTGYQIAKWDPVDSLAWLKAMAWDLRGNLDDELRRAQLLASGLTRAQIESLYPPYADTGNSPILSGGSVSAGQFQVSPVSARTTAAHGIAPLDAATVAAQPVIASVAQAIDELPTLVGPALPGIGSNSFVVSGRLSATGKPILENDPHLSPSMPGIWYQIGLHCTCAYNVQGFSFSGMPGVIIGHNGRIAWGFTNLDPDVTDLYLEKVKGDQYLVDGVWRDLTLRQETFKVAGGRTRTATIRVTDNGPLLSDFSTALTKLGKTSNVDTGGQQVETVTAPDPTTGGTYAVALKWTALTPGRTMDALFAMDTARDWTEFRAAAAQFEVPAQNLTYADVDGNIGYQAPGRIPVRGKGDGRWPAPGWDSHYDWTGYIPFAELPNELNPPQGYFTTANQEVVDPASYPHLLSGDWSNGYRSQRLADLIAAGTRGGRTLTVADVKRFAFDAYSTLAARVTPYLLAVPVTGTAARAQALLRGWDFQQPAGGAAGTAQGRSSAAAAYFNAVWKHLLAGTFDELPKDNKPNGDDRWWLVMTKLLDQPTDKWWDDASTSTVEHRDDVIGQALRQAATELSGTLGADPATWRWGAIHTLYVQNQSFGTSGVAPIEWLFNVGPVPVSGGPAIVDATGWDPSTGGYDVNAVPSMRMIVDLSNLDGSQWIQLTGESGHAFSPHYHDQLDLWRSGQTVPMLWSSPAVTRAARDTLTITP